MILFLLYFTSLKYELMSLLVLRQTSNALLWTLYCLAKNPEIQEAAYRATENVLPGRAPVTAESLQSLQYVRACLKEAFR